MPKPTATGRLPREETFDDLNRACTKFLLERDPKYRRDYEQFRPQRDAYNARVAAKKAASVLPQ